MIYIKNLIKSSKTPLKYTGKLSRLYTFSIFILLSTCFYKYAFAVIPILTLLCPAISNLINIYDKIKNKIFISKAKEKLKKLHPQVIAITGSNGKTSVKNILQKILSNEHKVQASPASFNTPIGIAKFINESLEKDTKFLILEYGARNKNDIKQLCKLYGADYGILTSISAQHLESFKSIKNIYFAKNQLPTYLQNKPCVFNIDNLYVRKSFEEKNTNKYSVSIHEKTSVYAKKIQTFENFTRFTLVFGNKEHNFKINLLGRHNISNICTAVALANIIGISDKNLTSAIENIKPIEHRLQLIKTHINIIDDSYNCSPSSAKEALWVLKNFGGKKMVATPGIIECGKQKYHINFKLGQQLSFCDYCVIIGNENRQAILDGINSKINPNIKIIFSKSLEESKQHFALLKNGDTLLILNDLPDDYS